MQVALLRPTNGVVRAWPVRDSGSCCFAGWSLGPCKGYVRCSPLGRGALVVRVGALGSPVGAVLGGGLLLLLGVAVIAPLKLGNAALSTYVHLPLIETIVARSPRHARLC